MKVRIVWFRLGQTPGASVVHMPRGAHVLYAGLHNGAAAICALVPDPPLEAGLGRPRTVHLHETGEPFDPKNLEFRGIVELPAATLHVFEELKAEVLNPPEQEAGS